MKININKEIQKISDDIYTYRRDFHQNPELSFQEYRTAETISKYLDSFGITHKTNIGETGIVGEIDFGEGPTIALRADMDALPIQEENEVAYCSKNNIIILRILSGKCDCQGHFLRCCVIRYLSKYWGVIHGSDKNIQNVRCSGT